MALEEQIQRIEGVDYVEPLYLRLVKRLEDRGYIVPVCGGHKILGILTPTVVQRTGLLGLVGLKQNVFLWKGQFDLVNFDCDDKYWELCVYGRNNLPELIKLAKSLSNIAKQYDDAKIIVKLACEQPRLVKYQGGDYYGNRYNGRYQDFND